MAYGDIMKKKHEHIWIKTKTKTLNPPCKLLYKNNAKDRDIMTFYKCECGTNRMLIGCNIAQ